ncbi:kinase [Bacillus sp. FJAT-27916]|uniref:kinase-associated lipoprotein B n=1 Tax=Bacillaceae TaxID=186817 RepID=UPI0006713F94|nr:kinase-associated lipoprotein B [Bacillus sp. FJAT-27916]KMY43311.1 kinase [Bacillus sp. FJAT-27916]
MSELQIGDYVTAFYKTGKYAGEITQIRPNGYIVVKTLAVLKHPMQGDLHNPKQADVDFFHERKALAHLEQTNVPANMVKPFEGELPPYKDSLAEALSVLRRDLREDPSDWAARSLECLERLESEYNL